MTPTIVYQICRALERNGIAATPEQLTRALLDLEDSGIAIAPLWPSEQLYARARTAALEAYSAGKDGFRIFYDMVVAAGLADLREHQERVADGAAAAARDVAGTDFVFGVRQLEQEGKL